jgi:hypothetical protein
MSKTNILPIIISALVVFAILTGCSGKTEFTTPSSTENIASFSNSVNMGEFALSLNPETMTAELTQSDRISAIKVTQYARITITGLVWDPITRIWDIDVNIGNPTALKAFGPWIVFSDTGDQKILDQDGFTWYQVGPSGPIKRVPVIAFAKKNLQRAFNPHSTEPVHLRIYWPDRVDSFEQLYFWIDVSYPGPRQEPIVENLEINPFTTPGWYSLTAYVKDWQVSGLNTVTVNLAEMGLPWNYTMFDDGMNGDGAPDDDIFGCIFQGPPPYPALILPVNAEDLEGYWFENDIRFGL